MDRRTNWVALPSAPLLLLSLTELPKEACSVLEKDGLRSRDRRARRAAAHTGAVAVAMECGANRTNTRNWRAGASKKQREGCEALATWYVELLGKLESHIHLPTSTDLHFRLWNAAQQSGALRDSVQEGTAAGCRSRCCKATA